MFTIFRKNGLIGLPVLLVVSGVPVSAPVLPVPGSPLKFEATDLQGKPFQGASLKGQAVLFDFWAVWCAPCIRAMPDLNRLHRDFKDRGFQVVGMAAYSGDHTDVGEFLQKHPVDYTVLVGDDSVLQVFEVIGFPTYVLVTPEGEIQTRYVGEVDDLYGTVAAEITKLAEARD